MVRTKTRPRTREERSPNGIPSIRLPPKTATVYENVIFKDHTGAQALMSWPNWPTWGPKYSLPPLASWIFYMTHPDVPRDFDGSLLYSRLEYDHQLGRGGHFRYEFFFLPGATVEQCHAHYLGEMEARGTIWRQIRKVERAVRLKKEENGEDTEDNFDQEPGFETENHSDQDSGSDHEDTPDSQLPGLVWPTRDRNGDYSEIYRGWFFIYPDADIECRTAEQKARDIYLVEFDPVSIPDWDEEEDGAPNPMDQPIRSTRMKAKGEDGFDSGLFGWMETRKISHWEEEANHATWEALKLGWKSW
ncbi:hypothetical protein CEP54_006631 [Fusarium duplospermum]|uniref:Uncharacterized protein n=1 Tax=Fusarium duplospermum TaxID=1325734 RepID=A0A428Q5R6_9HYPO|nr:hypothetical protein CEP54_006631 [Fusarium duplospermum]